MLTINVKQILPCMNTTLFLQPQFLQQNKTSQNNVRVFDLKSFNLFLLVYILTRFIIGFVLFIYWLIIKKHVMKSE